MTNMDWRTLSAPLDFPAQHGRPVTERHARTCRIKGHATQVVDGVTTGVCPRCGEVTVVAVTVLTGQCEIDPAELWPFDRYTVGEYSTPMSRRMRYAVVDGNRPSLAPDLFFAERGEAQRHADDLNDRAR